MLIAIVIDAVLLPVALLAVIVYDVDADVAVGVPVIAPVEVLKDNPAGKPGLIDQVVTGPPVFVGDQVEIAAPTEKVLDAGE